MTPQPFASPIDIAVRKAALLGLFFLLLYALLDLPSAYLASGLCATLTRALAHLPSLLLTLWETIQPYPAKNHGVADFALRLLSSSSLLHCISAVA